MTTSLETSVRPIHLSQSRSVDVRLSQRWGCQLGTARARRVRALDDCLDLVEECLALGDTERVGHIMSLFDAALMGEPTRKSGAIHACDRADVDEDTLECNYRETPNKQTARAWFDALGKEGRMNERCMAALRQEWML